MAGGSAMMMMGALPFGREIFGQLLPEIILLSAATLILLRGMLRARMSSSAAVGFSLAAIFASLWTAYRLHDAAVPQNEMAACLNYDGVVWYARLITLTVGALVLLVNRHVPAAGEEP